MGKASRASVSSVARSGPGKPTSKPTAATSQPSAASSGNARRLANADEVGEATKWPGGVSPRFATWISQVG